MQPHQRKRRPFKVALAVLIATLGSGGARAHQTYLIADLYELRPGTDNYLILKNGTYFESGYSITRKMSRDISIVMKGERKTPPDDEVEDVARNPSYKQTYIKVFAEHEGTGVAGLAAHPDYIALPAEMFEGYLEHEGLEDALAEFRATNERTTIRERYTKHAKGIFQVGEPLTEDFKHALDYKAEIVIEQNPGRVKVGDEMSMQVMFDGKPLANQQQFPPFPQVGPKPSKTVVLPKRPEKVFVNF